jgi:hypothetical protein
MPARLNFSQTTSGQPLTLSLSSLLTLPGVIPPTVAPILDPNGANSHADGADY